MKRETIKGLIFSLFLSAAFLNGCNNPTGNGGGSSSPAYYNPTWTPTGGILAEKRKGGSSYLILITQEGASDTTLFSLSSESWTINCAPDNNKIAITYDDWSHYPLWLNFKILDYTGTIETKIPNITWEAEFYDWSSDSKSIVFSGITASGESGLFTYNFDTQNLVRLASAEGAGSYSWHNGPKILYSFFGDYYTSYMINPDNTGLQLISSHAIVDNPQWFPDGDLTISYYACAIVRYRISNGQRSLINIQPYPTYISNANLSFDGTSIVCSGDYPYTRIYTTGSSGGTLTTIR
jgi:hypothetical protein